MNTEIPLMGAMMDALDKISIYKTDEQQESNDCCNIEMASQIIGDQLIVWEIELNERTGVIDKEIIKTARRYNKTDQNPLTGKWTDWRTHEDHEDEGGNLEYAIDHAITNHQGGGDPDIADVRLIVAEMNRKWVTTWKGLK